MLAGIVCEYNPFHKGHLYQLEKTKQAGIDGIICVMSGNFVQRGECAFLDKWKRAEIAVRSGADVVIDLPVPWAVSSGESFARGSVFLLKQFGVDVLSFGCECEDRENLLIAADVYDNERVAELVKARMSDGKSYPSAFYEAVYEIYGKAVADILALPNSTLAVEYIRQMKKYSDMDFIAVKRKGADHDSENINEEFISASALRAIMTYPESAKKAYPFLSDESADIIDEAFSEGSAPCTMEQNERAILSALRQLDKKELEKFVSDGQGLVSRIYDSIKVAENLSEVYSLAKSKNYTYSRIRREVLNAYLKIEKDISTLTPPYMRILAVNEKGLSLLSSAKKNSAIPIVTKHVEMQNLDSFSKKIYDIQCSSTDLFALFSPKVRACGLEQKNSMLIIK